MPSSPHEVFAGGWPSRLPTAAERAPVVASAGGLRVAHGSSCSNTTLHRSWMLAERAFGQLASVCSRSVILASPRCRDDISGIRPRPASAASTAWPRSPGPSSTHPIFAPRTCRAGRRKRRTPSLLRAPDATHVLRWPRPFPARRTTATVRGGDSRATISHESAFGFLNSMPATSCAPWERPPLYLGQPVALLIFEDFDAFDQGAPGVAG